MPLRCGDLDAPILLTYYSFVTLVSLLLLSDIEDLIFIVAFSLHKRGTVHKIIFIICDYLIICRLTECR